MYVSNLAFFIAAGTVDIKIAFKTPGKYSMISVGWFTDYDGNIICFRGSNNETGGSCGYKL